MTDDMPGAQLRKASVKEAQHLQASVSTAARCRCLPGTRARRMHLAKATIPTRAGWGWVFCMPSEEDIMPRKAACCAVTAWPKQAAVPLMQILMGHFWDLWFLATVTSILQRFVAKVGQLPRWTRRSGWTVIFRKGMRDLGWQEIRDWTWRLGATGQDLAFSAGSDLSAQQHLRNGLLASPQHFTRSGNEQELLPWCLPTWEHCTWGCLAAPVPPDVPMPVDALQRRLGWPTADPARANSDVAIARWLACVRETVLSRRHGHAEPDGEVTPHDLHTHKKRSQMYLFGGALYRNLRFPNGEFNEKRSVRLGLVSQVLVLALVLKCP